MLLRSTIFGSLWTLDFSVFQLSRFFPSRNDEFSILRFSFYFSVFGFSHFLIFKPSRFFDDFNVLASLNFIHFLVSFFKIDLVVCPYRHPIQTCNFSFSNIFLWKIHFPTRTNEWKLSKSHCTMCTKYLHRTRDKRDSLTVSNWSFVEIFFSFSGFPFQDWRSRSRSRNRNRNRNRNWLSIFPSLMSLNDSLAWTTTNKWKSNRNQNQGQIPVLTFNTRQNRYNAHDSKFQYIQHETKPTISKRMNTTTCTILIEHK